MAVIGVRDVVIGLGLLRGRRPAGWLRAQAAADAVDATIVGLALLGVGGHRGGPGHPGRRVDRARRPERPGAGETRTRCHRWLLKELLLAVARGRGLVVDPDTDELDRTLLEARRKAVLAAEGFPLICSVCGRPAGTARAIRGRDGYGYCSEACLEADVARWKAQLWSAGSGRRP
jgi:hypothetical protein